MSRTKKIIAGVAVSIPLVAGTAAMVAPAVTALPVAASQHAVPGSFYHE